MRVELIPEFDKRKSFYGKARYEIIGDEKKLYSYGTHVASIKENGLKLEVYGDYSMTTLRHIKEFAKQNGFIALNKQQILNVYGV